MWKHIYRLSEPSISCAFSRKLQLFKGHGETANEVKDKTSVSASCFSIWHIPVIWGHLREKLSQENPRKFEDSELHKDTQSQNINYQKTHLKSLLDFQSLLI